MENILQDIKDFLELNRISETRAAEMAGLAQKKVNRMLSGKAKNLDMAALAKIQEAVGMRKSIIPAGDSASLTPIKRDLWAALNTLSEAKAKKALALLDILESND